MIFNLPRLTPGEFSKFAKLIYEESGIFLKENKLILLSNRLRKKLKEKNFQDYSSYYDFVTKNRNREEIYELLDVVSTNETYFFRNEKQFKVFSIIIEELLNNFPRGSARPLRIWSAGCSTGDEPYTIALIINEKNQLLKGKEVNRPISVEIISTDISKSVLEFARLGCYGGRRIEKVSEEMLKNFFTKIKDKEIYSVNENLRSMVRFEVLNLFKDPYPKNLDIIFCRNVMIYFDKTHQRKLIEGFANVINSAGYLFIGHAESLYNISDRFVYLKNYQSPVYRKID